MKPSTPSSDRFIPRFPLVQVIALFTGTFLLYLLTWSISLDDWDSINFRLGLDSFDLFLHQPHPPGYPLYIFTGRFIHHVLHITPQSSLLLLSSLGGALFVSIWFLIISMEGTRVQPRFRKGGRLPVRVRTQTGSEAPKSPPDMAKHSDDRRWRSNPYGEEEGASRQASISHGASSRTGGDGCESKEGDFRYRRRAWKAHRGYLRESDAAIAARHAGAADGLREMLAQDGGNFQAAVDHTCEIWVQSWCVSLALAFAPITWLTSTQVLTDSPSTALFSLTLLLFLLFKRTKRYSFALTAAIAGGVTIGFRPQFFIIVTIITLYLLAGTTLSNRKILTVTFTLLLTCAAWLIPTMILQARRPLNRVGWRAYPTLLHRQWQWRKDKPEVYLGAGKTTFKRLARRINNHWGGWITKSLALKPVSPITIIGFVIFLTGIILAFLPALPHPPPRFPFWRANLLWAVPYTLIILFSLPPNRRYYLPIIPLLLLLSVRGWAGIKKRYRFGIVILPLILFWITLPLVRESHREWAPPIRMLNLLKARYEIGERPDVLLLLSDTYRHAQFYAPEFTIEPAALYALEEKRSFTRFGAIYTDSPDLVKRRWHKVRFVKQGEWRRSPLIHDKHTLEILYRVLPDTFQ